MTAAADARPIIAVVFDTDGYGGAEEAMAEMIEGLESEFKFLAIVGSDADPETTSLLGKAGCEIATVRGLRRRCGPLGFARLLRALRKLDPAAVHVSCSDQGGGFAPILAAYVLAMPRLATLHLVAPGRRRPREYGSGFVLRRLDVVIAVSEHVASYVRRKGGSANVIYNAVAEPSPRADAANSLGLTESDFVVGGLGRLIERKGWDVLCKASAAITERVAAARFIVIGDGPEQEPLERLPQCSDVTFAGFRPDAPSLVHCFDVLVVPSRWEGFGRVAAEAMMANVAVVASDVGGLPEVVGECGVLIPPNDPDALADAVIALAEDPTRRARLASDGRERARDRFSLRRQLAETDATYRSVISGTPG